MFTFEEFRQGRGRIMVMDVEAVGLQGEGFAVGYVVTNCHGPIAEVRFSCPPEAAQGSDLDRQWIKEHIPPLPVTHATPAEVRGAFWEGWKRHQSAGAMLIADCGWPVEHRFLAACVDDAPQERTWGGPYPLMEMATVLWLAGIDPLQTQTRLKGELPLHCPLADSRQSARLLLQAMGL